jgi:hypothetical protein
VKHQSFVGAGYFDELQMVITRGESSTVALKGSTEEEQFAVAAALVNAGPNAGVEANRHV